jgi:RNA polymerase sigma-70 factor (ECF subfamily)
VPITREVFENIFLRYYESLYGYALSILKNDVLAEDIVSDVFYKAWKKKDTIDDNANFAGYLYKSIYNASMDQLKHKKIKQVYASNVLHRAGDISSKEEAAAIINQKELENKLRIALLELPEQCRTVFHLNRTEELSYRNVSMRLGISVKTVEAHMGKALKRLRISLAEFLTLLIVLLCR